VTDVVSRRIDTDNLTAGLAGQVDRWTTLPTPEVKHYRIRPGFDRGMECVDLRGWRKSLLADPLLTKNRAQHPVQGQMVPVCAS
jgi:hypothetical protein